MPLKQTLGLLLFALACHDDPRVAAPPLPAPEQPSTVHESAKPMSLAEQGEGNAFLCCARERGRTSRPCGAGT